jgi:heptosyltransferase-1
MAEPRFLIVRLGSLGDILHTFPAVAAIRETFPAAEIVWLTHPRWKSLVESGELASEVWAVESRSFSSLCETISRVRRQKWESAIDYQGLWKSAALPFLGGVARRIGFSSETIREYGVPLLYTDRVRAASQHIADQNGELSLCAGARKPVAGVSLRVAPEDEAAVRDYLLRLEIDRYIVLSPGGGWRSKCWPAERFGALCQKIRTHLGLRCILNYGPGEQELVAAVLAASGAAAPVPYNETLGQLMALLHNAVCIVGGDTGPLHLAVALGTSAVALFGPTDPARNGPYGPGSAVLRSPKAVTTYKRGDEPDPSMLELKVDDVLAALLGRMGAKL